MNVSEAIAGDDRREILLALRVKLAAQIDVCESARDLPALTRALLNVNKEIAELDAGSAESVPGPVKELQERTKRKKMAVIL
ncbi:hypothetical protein [Nocardia arthritidis]|uniref:Uncharacterized protein n=1 Tax=Nocardia arthritidis TaxID=228602 RepID=A0A6G9Y4U4_9NOCA|nr:hypothetical protein [Nocardia arthritidis]QIS08211.1 hypothetical protein F5544_01440 [Nocardia arthritidis]